MDIDDDDEDVVLVSVDMTNEAAIPLGGLDIHIITSNGQKVESQSGISSLGPGLTRNFTFEFPLENGTWSFSVSGGGQSLSLGPYEAGFTFVAEQGRAFGNSIGSSLFSGAFNTHLDSFGNVDEREIIDPSQMVMTSYTGKMRQAVRPKSSSTTLKTARMKKTHLEFLLGNKANPKHRLHPPQVTFSSKQQQQLLRHQPLQLPQQQVTSSFKQQRFTALQPSSLKRFKKSRKPNRFSR